MVNPSLSEVLLKHTPEWLAIPGVERTGEGKSRSGVPCIVVTVSRPVTEFSGMIPTDVSGFAVVIREGGRARFY